MLKDALKYLDNKRFIGAVILLVVIVVAEATLTVYIPVWREYFYDILQKMEAEQFHTAVVYFVTLIGSLGVVQGIKLWISQLVSFQARTAISKLLISKWHNKGSKPILGHGVAMTESLSTATTLWLQVWMEVVISALILVALVATNLHQPLVLIAASGFTAIMCLVAVLFKRPLVNSDKNRQIAEGEYREAIARVKSVKEVGIFARLADLGIAYYRAVRIVMYFTLFSTTKSALSSVIPYLFMSGAYFSGAITLGQFMAVVSIFELFVVNATILLLKYTDLIKSKAAYNIVKEFHKKLD